jgi:protein phosphatase
MAIKFKKNLSLNKKGQRTNNEDNIYPNSEANNENDALYLVCDGVGGSEKGEIASELICKHIPDYFQKNNIEIASQEDIANAILYVEDMFEEYNQKNESSKGMASTLTLLHTNKNNTITIAHVGDSRVYHIRNNALIFCTQDHSLVNAWLIQGTITPEEAIDHPRKNVILRAVQGNSKRTKADVEIIADIKVGDYFFMCTDGILESISDDYLLEILLEDLDNEKKLEKIDTLCDKHSADNYSCYLLQVETIEEPKPTETKPILKPSQASTPTITKVQTEEKEQPIDRINQKINPKDVETNTPTTQNPEKNQYINNRWKIIALVVLLTILLVGLFCLVLKKKENNPNTHKQTNTTQAISPKNTQNQSKKSRENEKIQNENSESRDNKNKETDNQTNEMTDKKNTIKVTETEQAKINKAKKQAEENEKNKIDDSKNTNTTPKLNTNTTPKPNTNTTPKPNTNTTPKPNTNTTPKPNTNTTPKAKPSIDSIAKNIIPKMNNPKKDTSKTSTNPQ